MTAIFSRAVMQLSAGVVLGSGLMLLAANDTPIARLLPIFGVVGLVNLGAGLAACVLPAKRALRVQPMEALRGAD